MRFFCIQHEPFEPPGNIILWAEKEGYKVDIFRIYKLCGENNTNCRTDQDLKENIEKQLKDALSYDGIILLGGSMSVNDTHKFNWLEIEKDLIKAAIEKNKRILGICLGAQLIASSMDARVYPMPYKEIGFFPVYLTDEAGKSHCFKDLPYCFTTFHWHGEQFDLPEGARRLAYSKACPNQAFEYNRGKVLALQFHPETSKQNLSALIANSDEDLLGEGPYIQGLEKMHQMLLQTADQQYKLLCKILENWLEA